MRLRYVAKLNPPVTGMARGDAGVEVSFLPLERIWADDRFDPNETVEFSGDVESYNPVAECDILLPKVSPTFAHGRVAIARGLSNGRALATSEVFVLRAGDADGARFVSYRLRATDFRSEGEASWTGVAGLKRVSADFVRDSSIDEAAWSRRGAIADFLDRECDRISSLVGALDDLEPSLAEGQTRLIDDRFDASTIQLGRVAGVQTGLTLGGSYGGGDGLVTRPYLRVANVLRDRIVVDELATVAVPPAIAARTTLRAGDVLLTEGGDIDKLGRGAVWDGRISECLHQNHVFAVRCGPRLLPETLAVWTRGSVARDYFESTASRITNIASTNLTKLLRLPVPDLTAVDQAERLEAFRAESSRLSSVKDEVVVTRRLLTEYRDALITEAVTGQLDVPRLSEQQMDESARAAMEGEAPEVVSA